MLYWAEGSKTSGSVQFTNTDPEMLAFFWKSFLKPFYQVEDAEARVTMIFHDDNGRSAAEVEDYWLGILELPRTCLIGTKVKAAKKEAKRRVPYGTCRLTVHRMDLFQS